MSQYLLILLHVRPIDYRKENKFLFKYRKRFNIHNNDHQQAADKKCCHRFWDWTSSLLTLKHTFKTEKQPETCSQLFHIFSENEMWLPETGVVNCVVVIIVDTCTNLAKYLRKNHRTFRGKVMWLNHALRGAINHVPNISPSKTSSWLLREAFSCLATCNSNKENANYEVRKCEWNKNFLQNVSSKEM